MVIVNDIVVDAENCSGEITIPDNVKIIENYAFSECDAIAWVNLNEGLEQIRDCAFNNCKNLENQTQNPNDSNAGNSTQNPIEGTNSGATNAPVSNFIKGDVDSDKAVTLKEAKLVLKASSGIIKLDNQIPAHLDGDKAVKLNF